MFLVTSTSAQKMVRKSMIGIGEVCVSSILLLSLTSLIKMKGGS